MMIYRRTWKEAIVSRLQVPSLELSGVSDGTYICRQSGWPSAERESNSKHSEWKGEVSFQASAAK
jgi:hypothetical protein